MMMLKLSVLLCLLAAAAGYRFRMRRHSYSINPPFCGTEGQPFPVIPAFCPTSYILLTRHNRDHPEEMYSSGPKAQKSYFNPELETYIIIPGMWHTPEEPYVKDICQDILDVKPANCIIMDWRSCTYDLFFRLSQNARVLGDDLGDFISYLEETFSYDLWNIHMIANNVAAHIAGHAGRAKGGLIGSITVLDGTGSIFLEDVRLHVTRDDALCVQTIHTDANPNGPFSFGIVEPIGHISVYPNGGQNMPECPPPKYTLEEVLCILLPATGPFGCADLGFPSPGLCAELMGDQEFGVEDILSVDYDYFCTHHQATNYFLNSIKNRKKYLGHQCNSLEDCMNGVTQPCPKEGCRQLGFHARCDHSGPKMYFLNVTVTPVFPYW